MDTLTAPFVAAQATQMIAAVLHGSEDLKIESIGIPRLAPDEALVRVKVALTCGTDLKVWKRGYHARMITRYYRLWSRVGRGHRTGRVGCAALPAGRYARSALELSALRRLPFLPQAAK